MAPAAASDERPNVLLIISDDQGFAETGFHGNADIRTPNLDRLAGESVEFVRFYACPLCAPTRASLMTGRYHYRTGVLETYLGRALMRPEETTLAETLSAAGYRTAIFGKWHLGDNYPMRAMDQGFGESLVHRGGGIGQPSDQPGTGYFDPILCHNGRDEKQTGYCTDVLADAAVRFISQPAEAPFFVYLATNAPHAPLIVDEKYASPYRAAGLDDKTSRIYGMITNLDENVGKVLDALDRLDLSRRTIVIFMTDNGLTSDHFTAGLRGKKASVYEGGIRVPFLFRWPGHAEAGRKVDVPGAVIDVLPTLCEATGARLPAAVVDGRSLMPLVRGDSEEWQERALFFQVHRGDAPEKYRSFCAVTNRYKLVQAGGILDQPLPATPRFELFDLVADAGESSDVSAEHGETTARLKAAYERWFDDVTAAGFEPPRIHIGTKQENPTVLTRQDWRGPLAGWRKESLGYWDLEVADRGTYTVVLTFDEPRGPVTLALELGGKTLMKEVPAQATSGAFEAIELGKGSARLQAWIEQDGKRTGVRFAEVQRL
jgi:arylsulfatase A-like enzyme